MAKNWSNHFFDNMGGSSFKVQSHGPFYVKQFVLFFLLFQLTLRFWDKHSLYFPQKVAILRTRVHPSLYSTFTGLEGALLGNVFFGRFPLWLRRIKRLLVGNFYKVNRCLARYSPRATTTNRPTTGHWVSLLGLAQIDQKCQFWAKFGRFGAKNTNFYWKNQKFCYPHNRKLT